MADPKPKPLVDRIFAICLTVLGSVLALDFAWTILQRLLPALIGVTVAFFAVIALVRWVRHRNQMW